MSHRLRRGLVCVACCVASATVLALLGRAEGPALGEKYALLVGVRNYDKNELRNLPYAEADVTALADVLKKAGYQRVVLMTQTRGADEALFLPLAANIRTALKGLLADRAADDSVLVAFAGHGVQYQGEDDNYFCPMDAKLADKATLISLSEVYKDLENSGAGTRLLLADCCRNDPRSDQVRAADRVKLESVTRPQRAAPPGGVAALFSCSAGEKAFESADLGHGVFFHFVIEGLQGKADFDRDGQVSLEELGLYAKRQVADYVKDKFGDDVRQMPELIGKTHGTVALVRLAAGRAETPTETGTGSGGQPDAATDDGRLKEDYTSPTLGMALKLIRPGKFLMGSPKDEDGRDKSEGPQHEVEITKPLYMGVYPVTRGQFARFIKDDGYQTDAEKDGKGGYGLNLATAKLEQKPEYTWRHSGFSQEDDHPVVQVSWNDATAFCAWLSKKEGKTYELPTEAEWEYACRAGRTTRFWCGDTDASLRGNANIADVSLKAIFPGAEAVAWNDSFAFTSPVGHFKANPWGLYDMGGNVNQWCADWYGPYQEGSIKSSSRVVRGGSWYIGPLACRSANRNYCDPAFRIDGYGFRVVLRVPVRNQ